MKNSRDDCNERVSLAFARKHKGKAQGEDRNPPEKPLQAPVSPLFSRLPSRRHTPLLKSQHHCRTFC